MKINSKLFSLIAVFTLCFTLFSFKSSDGAEAQMGMATQVVAPMAFGQDIADHRIIASLARSVTRGITRGARAVTRGARAAGRAVTRGARAAGRAVTRGARAVTNISQAAIAGAELVNLLRGFSGFPLANKATSSVRLMQESALNKL